MGHIWDFLRSVSPNLLKPILKSPGFVPFSANLADFGAKSKIRVEDKAVEISLLSSNYVMRDPSFPETFQT